MNNTDKYYSPKQGRLPLFITDFLDICDPVLAFDKIMEEIEIEKHAEDCLIRFYGHRVCIPERIGRSMQNKYPIYVSDGLRNAKLPCLQLLH